MLGWRGERWGETTRKEEELAEFFVKEKFFNFLLNEDYIISKGTPNKRGIAVLKRKHPT